MFDYELFSNIRHLNQQDRLTAIIAVSAFGIGFSDRTSKPFAYFAGGNDAPEVAQPSGNRIIIVSKNLFEDKQH